MSLDEWYSAAIEEGMRAADNGLLIDHKVVVAWVGSWTVSEPTNPPMVRPQRD